MTAPNMEVDNVSRVIKHCIADHLFAEKAFNAVAKDHRVTLPDGEVRLSEEEVGEFVARYSSEVEPTIWESKRRKN